MSQSRRTEEEERIVNHIAKIVMKKYGVERSKIVKKYQKKIENYVWEWLFDKGVHLGKDSSWKSKLIPAEELTPETGLLGYFKLRTSSFNTPSAGTTTDPSEYASGVTSELREKQEDGHTVSSIIISNKSRPQKPIFRQNSPIEDESLTEWIVGDGKDSKIHPLPPHDWWWPKDEWEDMYYKAYPYFDKIMESNGYKKMINDLTRELSKTYQDILINEVALYKRRRENIQQTIYKNKTKFKK